MKQRRNRNNSYKTLPAFQISPARVNSLLLAFRPTCHPGNNAFWRIYGFTRLCGAGIISTYLLLGHEERKAKKEKKNRKEKTSAVTPPKA